LLERDREKDRHIDREREGGRERGRRKEEGGEREGFVMHNSILTAASATATQLAIIVMELYFSV